MPTRTRFSSTEGRPTNGRGIASDTKPIAKAAAAEIVAGIAPGQTDGPRKRGHRQPLEPLPVEAMDPTPDDSGSTTASVATIRPTRGTRSRAAKAKVEYTESDASLSPPPSPTAPASPPRAKVARRTTGRSKTKSKAEKEGDDEPHSASEPTVGTAAEDANGASPTKRKRAPGASAKAAKPKAAERETHIETHTNVHGEQVEVEVDEEGDPVRRNKNGKLLPKRKKKEVVYEIPEVQHRDFRLEGPPDKREERKDGFRGELGYACLNTVLRWQDPPVFSSRTARIKTMDEQGPEYIKELGRLNARDMIPMILWNEANGIRFMRLSSEVFPFASHAKYGYSLKYAERELRNAGDLARKLGHRLTMHPGQFTQLGSPRPEVIEAAIRDLNSHCEMLDLMGMDQDSVMIIHGGGVFGDRQATLARIKETYTTRLSDNVKARLVLENDEMAYSADELLPLCKELSIPLVFDFHHDLLRPSARPPSELLPEIQEIWRKRGIRPKYHLSEPRPGASNLRERRAHSDRCGELPPDLPADAHLMIEAKDKEQAVLELHRIYNIRPVVHESLRPPHEDIGVKTSGRKGKLGGEHLPRKPRGRAKAKATSDEDGAEDSEALTAEGDDAADPDADYAPAKGTRSPSKAAAKADTKASNKAKILAAINKAKEVAARTGREYKGPSGEAYEESDAKPEDEVVKSSQEVLEDMKVEAEWVRAELRAGRQRRVYLTEETFDEDVDDADQSTLASGDDGQLSIAASSPKKASPTGKRTGGAKRKRGKVDAGGLSVIDDGASAGGPPDVAADGETAVLQQGAPPEELQADHEEIPLVGEKLKRGRRARAG
ncbi:related to UV-endonuclease UVE-1 [Pseudozyma flocculosa]|nr:related to UV-endonuclease UVE-1 [Pseudozyma flocculosa]